MRLRIAILFAIAATLCTRMPAQTLTRVLSGYCDTVSNPGQEFVLFGLGERFTAPYAPGKEYTACTFGPGSPSVFLGEVVGNGGTVKNLYVKQTQLNSATMGGTVRVWINPKTGGPPIQTSISCTLGPHSTGFYSCNNTTASYSGKQGDRVIIVVTPIPGQSISPVSATLDVVFVTGSNQGYPILAGYCGSVSNIGLPFVLNGMGQNTTGFCNYGPGSPNVSAFLGSPLPQEGVGSLLNLYVKQESLNSAAMGGSISVWVNPKAGGTPVQTSIACTLQQSGSIYECNDTVHKYSYQPGDKVIVIVTPPPGSSISPVTATLDQCVLLPRGSC